MCPLPPVCNAAAVGRYLIYYDINDSKMLNYSKRSHIFYMKIHK
jgi:hypothetical protein